MEQIITSHIVKPSSPTPVGLKIHKLSSLDQFAPAMYVPLIFFYENDESKQHTEISQRLRQSLSEILTIFYPLAGTLKENSFIDCNDRGAELVEARVHARLAQFTQHPKMEELQQLLPVGSFPHKDNLLLSVKATFFDCGGVAVGACLSHKISDASSSAMFMNAWAATCRGETSGIIHPSFDLALHFPPIELSSAYGFHIGITEETIVTKRLVFEREELEKIRKQVAAWSDEVKDPSRVEAVSVFIWRSFIEAHKAKSGRRETASFMATHAVNLRPRTVPPIPDHTFGNCLSAASAVVSWEEDESESESGVHVSKLRAAIRAVDGDYINNVIKNSDDFFGADQFGDLFKAGNCLFSSWWRFPVYGVDFGWGKPAWACTATMPYMNGIVLMSTPSGDGIEAWANLPDEDFFQLLQANCNKLLLD